MPPLKEYIFEHSKGWDIKITVKAYNITQANDKLRFATKHPTDYKLISN